jgi:hypothetical protein
MDRVTSRRTALKSVAVGAALSALWKSPAAAAPTPDEGASLGAVNVRAFGAVGDGVIDDTNAIRAAVNAAFDAASASRNRVYFPAGTYLISGQINLDYGIVIEGAGPAASTVKMDPSILSDMFVGAGGFPVATEFRNIGLDGGFSWFNSKLDVPEASGTAVLSGRHRAGVFYDQMELGSLTVPIRRGDVLRMAGQPATFSADGVPKKVGFSGPVFTPLWAPVAPAPAPSSRWSIFGVGDIVSNLGRLIIDNCWLTGSKRHCISLPASGEIRISRCKIGVSQGCGVFSDGAGDGAIVNCWFVETGGANVYTYNATDFRLAQCLIEGGGVANVYSDWGQVKINSSDLWGGRAGNIIARQSGWIRCADLQLRDPGTGGVAGALGSTGWTRPAARPAVDCHFAEATVGAVITGVALASASDNLGAFSPRSVVRISNGSRSNLAQVEFQNGITFEKAPIEDAGIATSIQGCRGHRPAHVTVSTVPGPNVILANPLGAPAALVVKTTARRIVSIKMGSGAGAVEVFSGGSEGTDTWQRQYTTPPVAPGASVTVSTDASETGLSTVWFAG